MNKLFFTLLLLALAAYAQQERIAIINTLDDYDSISVANLTYLTDKLRETAVKVLPAERFGVMTTESIVAFLGSFENTVKVCKESSCLAELGRKVSADYVAQGRIGRFGNDLTIKVELYSVITGNLIGSFTGDSKNIYGLRDIINDNAPDLFKNMLTTSPPKPVTIPPPPKPEYTPPASTEIPPVEPEIPMAEENEEGEYDYISYIQYLIKKNLEKNKERIQNASSHISPVDRELLYEKNRSRSALGYVALNVLPGFGIGSLVQGDIAFGVTQSVLEITAFIIGFVLERPVNYCGSFANDDYCSENDRKNDRNNKIRAKIVVPIFITSYLTGLIRPFFYQSKYNQTLIEALTYIDENISFSIDPLIVPRDGVPAVGLAFNVRY